MWNVSITTRFDELHSAAIHSSHSTIYKNKIPTIKLKLYFAAVRPALV